MNSTGTLSFLSALLVLALCVTAPCQTNLLVNPGFESGSTGPDGWNIFPVPPPPGVNFLWDSTVSHGGFRSVAVDISGGNLGIWRQTVPVTEGTVYTFAGYSNVRDVAVPGSCTLQLVFRDSGGAIIETVDVLRHSGTIEWIYDLPHESCFRAPAGAVGVDVSLLLDGDGTVWFDDILFGPTPLGSVGGTVTNGAGPVAGATVEVWGTDLSAVTGANGRYVITGIPVASPRYVLIASHPAYRSLAAGNVDVEEDAATDVDFVLRPGQEPADLEIRVKCGRLIWKGDTDPNPVNPLGVIDPTLYPPEVAVFLAPHEYIDSDHPLVVQTAAAILDTVDPAERNNTLAVSYAAYKWIVRNVEWDGVYSSPNYIDVTSGAWQTISGVGWCYANSFAEWLYKPSEMIAESRGICIEHGKLDTAILRALGIPARPMQPYGGAHFWVQLPWGDGYWAVMNTTGGRSAFKSTGNLWAGYAATSESSIYGYPVDAGGWIHSDWHTDSRCLWREAHPWSERYESSPAGYAQAVADLQIFSQTGVAPQAPPPPPGEQLEIDYSDFTLDLRNIGAQRIVTARFPLPVDRDEVYYMGQTAYWTDHPECVTSTWFETISNPPVAETNCWFNIEFDMSDLLPPVELEICDLKANGSDGPIDLDAGDRLVVTLSTTPGGLHGAPADWWLSADAPFGWFCYRLAGFWTPGFKRTYAGPLVPISSKTVIDTNALPPGDYTIYFAVDALDGEARGRFYDKVEISVL